MGSLKIFGTLKIFRSLKNFGTLKILGTLKIFGTLKILGTLNFFYWTMSDLILVGIQYSSVYILGPVTVIFLKSFFKLRDVYYLSIFWGTIIYELFFSVFEMTNMYAVRFHSNESVNLQTSSQALECKRFENRLFSSPSDRHIYTAKFYAHPIR